MHRQVRGEVLVLLALVTVAVLGCVPPPATVATVEIPEREVVDDLLPPYAMSAKPHIGSLAVHSTAREGGDQMPSPSSDGSWFAFMSTRNSTSPQIYRQPSTGSVVTQLTKGPNQHIQPAVSPDGAEIAYAGDDNGTWDIWIMPATGGPRENLTSTTELNEVAPAWHPAGRILAFVCERSGTREQWVCAKERGAGGVSWITPGSNPCWSPSGDMLVFQRAKKRGRREESLWAATVTVDAGGLVSGGTESQILANTAWGIVEPEFSPDGRRIAFTAIDLADGGNREKRGDIWCVRVDGTDLIRLTNTPEADYDPAWAGVAGGGERNGRIFYASWRNGHQNIWSLMPALSGPPGALEGVE